MYVPEEGVRPPDWMRSPYSGRDASAGYQAALAEFGPVERIDNIAAVSERAAVPNENDLLVWFGPAEQMPAELGIRAVLFAESAPNIGIENLLIERALREWGQRLTRCSRVIVPSAAARRGIKTLLGEQFCAGTVAYPAPENERVNSGRISPPAESEIKFGSGVLDSLSMRLSPDFLVPQVRPLAFRAIPAPEPLRSGPAGISPPGVNERAPEGTTQLRGIVYVSDFDALTENANSFELISAFCDAFRNVADVTLVLRLAGPDLDRSSSVLIEMLCRYAPVQCRVVAFRGPLDHETYERLVSVASYYVHASGAPEGGLSVVEFMARGVPAIVAAIPAFQDYANAENALLVDAMLAESMGLEGTKTFPASRYDVNWQSLHEQFERSYQLAKDRERYEALSKQAAQSTSAHCSVKSLSMQFAEFFRQAKLAEFS